MTETIQTLAAALTHETAEVLLTVASATPLDKLHWKPLDNGRSILAQLVECATANQKWADLIRTRTWVPYGEQVWQGAFAEYDTLEKVSARLRETTESLASAILALSNADLSGAVECPWGLYPMPRCCFHAYWNMVYHEGQINYVQTLYGDFEEHEPEPEA